MASLVNLCLYELGWFACVLGAAGQRPDLSVHAGACPVPDQQRDGIDLHPVRQQAFRSGPPRHRQ